MKDTDKDLWRRKMIPLELLSLDVDSSKFREWAHEAIPNADERELVNGRVSDIRGAFSMFNLPFLALPVTTPRDTALGASEYG